MKNIISLWLIILCMVTFQTTAQIHDSSLLLKVNTFNINSPLQSSEHQKKLGQILRLCGAGLFTAGLLILTNDYIDDVDASLARSLFNPTAEKISYRAGGPVLALAGIGTMVGGFSLFKASKKSKHATTLLLKSEAIFFHPKFNSKEQLVSVSVQIN